MLTAVSTIIFLVLLPAFSNNTVLSSIKGNFEKHEIHNRKLLKFQAKYFNFERVISCENMKIGKSRKGYLRESIKFT